MLHCCTLHHHISTSLLHFFSCENTVSYIIRRSMIQHGSGSAVENRKLLSMHIPQQLQLLLLFYKNLKILINKYILKNNCCLLSVVVGFINNHSTQHVYLSLLSSSRILTRQLRRCFRYTRALLPSISRQYISELLILVTVPWKSSPV